MTSYDVRDQTYISKMSLINIPTLCSLLCVGTSPQLKRKLTTKLPVGVALSFKDNFYDVICIFILYRPTSQHLQAGVRTAGSQPFFFCLVDITNFCRPQRHFRSRHLCSHVIADVDQDVPAQTFDTVLIRPFPLFYGTTVLL